MLTDFLSDHFLLLVFAIVDASEQLICALDGLALHDLPQEAHDIRETCLEFLTLLTALFDLLDQLLSCLFKVAVEERTGAGSSARVQVH